MIWVDPGKMSCEELSHVLTEQDEQGMFMCPHIKHLRVTERLNAATEERLKTGHAVGALSIV